MLGSVICNWKHLTMEFFKTMDLIVPSKELLPPVTNEGVAILETLDTSWKTRFWLNEGINLRKKTWPNESIYQQRRLHGRQTSPCSNSFHLWILRERVQLLSHEVKKGALNQIPSIMYEVNVRHSCRHEVNDGMGQKLSESPSLYLISLLHFFPHFVETFVYDYC